ncbi:MAG: hypothetical protein J0H69_19525 [Burkholderiales bacterium]|nr:hypothetical protein [Burkholderiales bacterium]
MSDVLLRGAPFAIGEAVVESLRSGFSAQEVRVLDNPVRAADLSDGQRIVFYEDQPDRAIEKNRRVFSFAVGVINRTAEARLGAHTDYRRAKRLVRDAIKGIAEVVQPGTPVREGEVIFRLENIDVGGSLVLGTFTVDYRDPD